MKTIIVITILILTISLLEAACSSPKIRKEIRELTDDEYNRYIRAVLALKERKSETTLSVWEEFTKLHFKGSHDSRSIHFTPAFLPWHRKFIKEYELELQKIDPTVNLPYWDWSIDAAEPHNSPVLTPLYLGGNGNRTQDNILDNGPFNYTQLIYPNVHPLRRNYNNGDKIDQLASITEIKLLSADTEFSKMGTYLEFIHAAPHVFIGNEFDFGTSASPNDPIFFLHHAFVDLVWAKWQEIGNNFNKYDGVAYGNNSTQADKLYGYTDTVNSTFDFKVDPYCYDYPSYPREIIPVRTNERVTTKLYKKRLIDDLKLNSIIEGLNFDQAIAKLESLVTLFTPLLDKLNNFEMPKENLIIPKRTPLSDKWIEMSKMDKTKVRDFEAKQVKLIHLFKRLYPIKDKLH